MNDIEKKALALENEVRAERGLGAARLASREHSALTEALCRAIEQHEAFRQEVSDTLLWHWRYTDGVPAALQHLIITNPVDPLVEVLTEMNWAYDDYGPSIAADFHEALAKRGGKIVWGDEQ